MKISGALRKSGNRASGGLTCSEVRNLYYILLGREPESEEVLDVHAGVPLRLAISGFVASDEFQSFADTAIAGGVMPHVANLSHDHYQAASGWLFKNLNVSNPEQEPSWWLLLQALFQHSVETGDDPRLQNLQRTIVSRAEAHSRRHAPMKSLVNFNPSWFGQRYPQARLAVQTGAYRDFADYFLAFGLENRMQVAPAFSEGLAPIYARFISTPNTDVATIASSVFAGARDGQVGHWLFDDKFYRESLNWKTGRTSLGEGASEPHYLEFLNFGDHEHVAPHPLFSHYAYRTRNSLPEDDRGYFADFLLEGSLQGRVTSALFDEDFYLAFNPDVKQKLLKGQFASSLHHFVVEGMKRNYRFCPDFDVDFYQMSNPDVTSAVASGTCPSATHHFIYAGLAEGRAPNPYFDPAYYSRRHPDIGDEMRRLGIRTPIEHFLLVGRDRGFKANPPLTSFRPALDGAKAVFKRRAKRSVNNLLREPRDFNPYTADQPALSVVVPVFNEVDFTARFLECAYFAAGHFKQSTGQGCEIVFVNNGSTDLTAELIASCDGTRAVNFPEAVGFPRAVNAGITASKGPIVIVANNDVEFAPDAFFRCWQRMTHDNSIGMLGGMVILPNETIQEAGSFLDSKANVAGLGRFEDPWDVYFQGLNEADYCSGCFIALRKADVEAVNGLDESFSPGYFEETDLAFRLRDKLGKRAVVDSALQIVHFEHASFGKGRPPMTAYALIKRNQSKFASKHRPALAKQPKLGDLLGVSGVRPTAIGRSRLLVIEDMIPDARLGSGFVRTCQFLAGLTEKDVAFDLLALNPSALVDDYQDPRVKVYRGWMPGEDADTILASLDRYSHVIVCRTHNLHRFGARLEEMRQKLGFTVICDTEALSALRFIEMNRLAGGEIDEGGRVEAVRAELDSPVHVDHWIAVSPNESDLITESGFGPTTTLCQRVTANPVTQDDWDKKRRVLVVGAVHDAGSPNHDALLWFMDRVYPQCREVFDDHQLTIVGFWKADLRDQFLARYADQKIDFFDTVSEERLVQLYREAKIALAPTRFAAGIAIKVVESMALGVPIVMTDLIEGQIIGPHANASSGLAVGDRDDGNSFSKWVADLATNERLWSQVRQRQLEIVAPLSSREAFISALDALVDAARIAVRKS